jgi:hypothetical protein
MIRRYLRSRSLERRQGLRLADVLVPMIVEPHLDQEMPIPGFHGAFFANTQFTLENGAEWHDKYLGEMKNGYSAQNLRIAMSDHSGTHIDQLNHVGIKQENGEYWPLGSNGT